MISKHNTKLGVLPNFSLPVMKTCPGRTDFCDRSCYGLKGNFILPSVKLAHQRNLVESQQSDFVDRIVLEIAKSAATAFRLHVVGDFYSEKYIARWLEIADRLPDVHFFGSTRSWRVPKLREILREFRDLPNVYMCASIDVTHSDEPNCNWRVWTIDGDGTPCPHDYGNAESCLACRMCFTENRDVRFKLRWGPRTPLSQMKLF